MMKRPNNETLLEVADFLKSFSDVMKEKKCRYPGTDFDKSIDLYMSTKEAATLLYSLAEVHEDIKTDDRTVE
jgi:hypothetical protein